MSSSSQRTAWRYVEATSAVEPAGGTSSLPGGAVGVYELAVASLAMAHENVTVLLTGAAGLLGTWLRRTAPTELNVVPATHRHHVSADDVVVDLRDRDAVASALTTVKPGLVIHAGYAPDHASIVDATRNVLDMAQEVGADLLFVSSEAVFAGDGAPRSEAARPDPVWDYGRWKVEAEHVVSGRDPNAAIVRLPLIISVDPDDHILADIRVGQENGEPTVWYSDEMRQPASAEELSRAIWDITSLPVEKRTGVWHLPGPERLSRYEIADRAVAALGLDRSSIVSALTPVEAHRPHDLISPENGQRPRSAGPPRRSTRRRPPRT